MKARLLLVAVVLACSGKPPAAPVPATPPVAAAPAPAAPAAPAPPPAAVADVGNQPGSGSGAPARTAEPEYRGDPARLIDPATVGTGKHFLAVSESPAASKAARDVMAAGGNAVDAAVALAFALAVTHPTAGNIAGGGFAVVRTGPGKAVALDFRELAPSAASADMYLDKDGNPTDKSLHGDLAVGVPGSVAGLWELHHKLGKKPWKAVVAPAIALARDGFEVTEKLHQAIVALTPLLEKSPASAAMWLPGGVARATGDRVTNPEIATVLGRIADHGPDGFYKGETAAAIVAEMKAGGGIITASDLAKYKPIWRDPLRFSYRGYSVAAMPLPSSGGIVLAMTAGMLGKLELGKLPWYGTEHIHWLTEVWRRAFAARNELLGDPAYVKDVPVAKLVSRAYLDQLFATITDKATPSREVTALLEGDHTTNLCTVDASGMAVALTTTLNTAFGNGVTVAGFFLNNEMDDFASKPGSPNTFGLVQGAANKIEPGKRMLSSMSPTIVEDDKGRLFMLAGAGGGPRIITAVWQTISNAIDFGKTADLAVAAPRIHHQHLPDMISIEAGAIEKSTDEQLRAMGYRLHWGEPHRAFAAITAIERGASGWDGTSDPRAGGAAIGD
ncbi:MAG TPA: gamma-glutamyltransferase [Kofleriaceae bacterium]|jgi:gamma-glutamyltranspeptidase/glutathione hydrolase|nr:gamma-glutamyltransferase [Kofleriaceae bacterium]